MKSEIRKAVWRKSKDNRCWYCGHKLDPFEFHVDHFNPRSRGGSDDLDNLVPTCIPCNLSKSGMWYFEWREKIKNELGIGITEWFMNRLESENLLSDFLKDPNKWLPNLLFWFERDTWRNDPIFRTAIRYKGWLYE